MLNIKISNYAKKFLRKCDKNLYTRILSQIKELSDNPFPQNVKRITGRKEKTFRVRTGKHRITYVVFKVKKIIFIADIDKRGRIYKNRR